jgi:hypothetical protein
MLGVAERLCPPAEEAQLMLARDLLLPCALLKLDGPADSASKNSEDPPPASVGLLTPASDKGPSLAG